MSVNLGRVAYVEKGKYKSDTTYESKDVVSFNGGSYVFIGDTPAANVPPTNEANWQPLIDPTAMNDKIAELDGIKEETLTAAATANEKAQEATAAAETANTAAQRADEARESFRAELNGKASVITNDASGEIVHITDGAAMPVESLVSQIEPKQDGSGDPSPDNVRPIIGWDEVNVTNDTSSQTLTADLPETVYGGVLDWTTGVLTVDKAIVPFDGTETWHVHGSITNTVYRTKPAGMSSAIACSHYRIAAVANNDFSANIGSQLNFRDSVNAVDVATWKAYLAAQASAGTPVTLVCARSTPYTIQLTPQQMETLKGTNNIWSDAGATEVTYAADTKMYADGKDSTAMIGTAEPGMIATKNYASGDFIVVGKSLYKATAAIATGEAITPGTNCTATTVVEQLAAIYNLLNA